MLEAFFAGAANFFQPQVVLFCVVASAFGIIAGLLHGVSGITAAILFLPFLYGLPPELGIGFLVALASTVHVSGGITAILINIPGTPAATVTLLDGFPMNMKGEGGRAIAATVTSSMMGGIVAVFLAFLMIPVLSRIVLAFQTPEMFVMIVTGLCFLVIVSGDSVTKGMIAGLLGIMVSLIGFYGPTGTDRFTFGSMFLWDGLSIGTVALGLFGIPELVGLMSMGQGSISSAQSGKLAGRLQGIKDVFIHKWLFLRSVVIGYVVGVIPGMGSEIATWVTYGQAKQMSKTPEKFGTGCVEGVIAPESADNAKDAGAILTTLAFGIPGSAVCAIYIGGLIMVGVTPGPVMLRENLPLAFTLLTGLAFANLVAGGVCLGLAPYLGRVSAVPIKSLFPTVLILLFVGAFVAADNNVAGLVVLIVFGIAGIYMHRYKYPRAAFILGFVLGNQFEYYMWLGLKHHGPLFFMTPISLIMIIMVIGLFSYRYIGRAISSLRASKT